MTNVWLAVPKKKKKVKAGILFKNLFVFLPTQAYFYSKRDRDCVMNVSQKQLPWVSFFPFVKECTYFILSISIVLNASPGMLFVNRC